MESKDEKKPASPVSRSVYQKLAEENKRLKADIYSLVMLDTEKEDSIGRWIEVTRRWKINLKRTRSFVDCFTNTPFSISKITRTN